MKDYNWSKFHDWIIGSIQIDWTGGIIRILFRFEKKLEIKIIDFRRITTSRLIPWGRSEYINFIECTRNNLDEWRLEVELQSGDKILVEGSRIEIIE